MKMFNGGGLLAYSMLCAGLLLASHVSAQVSDWSAKVIGGTACNSQANFTSPTCPDNPNRNGTCTETYQACNQQSGNATKICQVEGGTANSCSDANCNDRKDDTETDNDAAGAPCVPTNI